MQDGSLESYGPIISTGWFGFDNHQLNIDVLWSSLLSRSHDYSEAKWTNDNGWKDFGQANEPCRGVRQLNYLLSESFWINIPTFLLGLSELYVQIKILRLTSGSCFQCHLWAWKSGLRFTNMKPLRITSDLFERPPKYGWTSKIIVSLLNIYDNIQRPKGLKNH